MVPTYTKSLPEDIYRVVSMLFERWGTVHVSFDSNGDLIMLEEAPSPAVIAMVYVPIRSTPPYSHLPTTACPPPSALVVLGSTSIIPVTPSPNADITALSSVLLLDMAREHLHHSTPAPAPQVVDSAETNLDPTIILLPSNLTHFLKHAEANLGVQNAQLLEPALWQLGAGPDILSEMDDAILHDAGVTPGDIICLK
ncbi:hypothetical protein F5J12DRAFT_888596 [Pisolithus orientalis]|uniref:uncharacterized protein n=1 Tax=Pisolithus orientalis TaxID=936130 RepID=UPI002224DC1D|nr:uncharacterized protein F5J12DRAFT_888596 [Pisolithus orientalis]KAI6030787.1 hypothetical protein F5J12DRAFT_888596 [Pisolithus orientalis]